MSNLLSNSVKIKAPDFLNPPKYESGIANGWILESRNAGIIRPKNQEPYEGELILLASRWGLQEDLTPLKTIGFTELNSVAAARTLEPGSVRFFLVLLPVGTKYPRPVGPTPINNEHLNNARSFDSLDDALGAFHGKRS